MYFFYTKKMELVDGKLVYKLGKEDNWIREFQADEIFTKQNISPFLMIANAAGGKTTIGVDIFKNCLRGGTFNHFSYITSTYSSP